MKLEWFRHHKRFVYWLLLPLVVITVGIFGASSRFGREGGGGDGPGITYRVGNDERYMSPTEVLDLRSTLAEFNQRHTPHPSSDEAANHQAAFEMARELGFEVGHEELVKAVASVARQQILERDRSAPDVVPQEQYHQLMRVMHLSPSKFERHVHQLVMTQKWTNVLAAHMQANDLEVFVAYAMQKEVVRLRYLEIKSDSKEFLDQAKDPDAAAITKFHQENKENPQTFQQLKNVMFTKPQIEGELLYLDAEKFFGKDVSPSKDDLLKFYERVKTAHYRDPKKAGKPGEFKPFDEVKADVEKRWVDDQLLIFYHRYKSLYWQVPLKAGETPLPSGEEKFQEFETVKAAVEAKWKGDFSPAREDLERHYELVKKDYRDPLKAGTPNEYKPLDEVKAEVERRWKEDQLQKFYNDRKKYYWKIQPKPGEPAPPPGEEKYEEFEKVKESVESRWKEDERRTRPQARLTTLKDKLKEAEDKHIAARAALPPDALRRWTVAFPALRTLRQVAQFRSLSKPFDVARWAESRGLVYWTTPAQTEEQYKKGKREPKAADAAWIASLFINPNRKEFGNPQPVGQGGVGVVVARAKSEVKEQPMSEAEAAPAIAAHLKTLDAVEQARKLAGQKQQDWSEGVNIPPLDTLEEIRGGNPMYDMSPGSRHALVQLFFRSPKPIGEVLPVGEARLDEANPDNPHKRFYVGFAVERELPTLKTFDQDMDPRFNREEVRQNLLNAYADFLFGRSRRSGVFGNSFDLKKVPETKDPPLFTGFHNSPD